MAEGSFAQRLSASAHGFASALGSTSRAESPTLVSSALGGKAASTASCLQWESTVGQSSEGPSGTATASNRSFRSISLRHEPRSEIEEFERAGLQLGNRSKGKDSPSLPRISKAARTPPRKKVHWAPFPDSPVVESGDRPVPFEAPFNIGLSSPNNTQQPITRQQSIPVRTRHTESSASLVIPGTAKEEFGHRPTRPGYGRTHYPRSSNQQTHDMNFAALQDVIESGSSTALRRLQLIQNHLSAVAKPGYLGHDLDPLGQITSYVRFANEHWPERSGEWAIYVSNKLEDVLNTQSDIMPELAEVHGQYSFLHDFTNTMRGHSAMEIDMMIDAGYGDLMDFTTSMLSQVTEPETLRDSWDEAAKRTTRQRRRKERMRDRRDRLREELHRRRDKGAIPSFHCPYIRCGERYHSTYQNLQMSEDGTSSLACPHVGCDATFNERSEWSCHIALSHHDLLQQLPMTPEEENSDLEEPRL